MPSRLTCGANQLSYIAVKPRLCHFEPSEKSAEGYLCSDEFFVYITTNPNGEALYIGITNNLEQRIIEHYLNRGKPKTHAGKYYCYCLLYYETFKYVNDAIIREKELKKWRREKKETLISSFNPERANLNKELFRKWPLPDEELFHREDC